MSRRLMHLMQVLMLIQSSDVASELLKVVKLFLPIVPELVARQLSCEDTDAVNITRSSRPRETKK